MEFYEKLYLERCEAVRDWVVALTAKDFGLEPDKILGKRRKQDLADARHFVFFCLRRLFKFQYPLIGKIMDRDHSTAIHGVNRIEERLVDPGLPDFELLVKIIDKKNELDKIMIELSDIASRAIDGEL